MVDLTKVGWDDIPGDDLVCCYCYFGWYGIDMFKLGIDNGIHVGGVCTSWLLK